MAWCICMYVRVWVWVWMCGCVDVCVDVCTGGRGANLLCDTPGYSFLWGCRCVGMDR